MAEMGVISFGDGQDDVVLSPTAGFVEAGRKPMLPSR